MERPDAALYPLNYQDAMKSGGDTTVANKKDDNSDSVNIYPDYEPWKDHNHLPSDKAESEKERMNNATFLNKGSFEAPQVSNEYYSSRNLIQATIFSSTANCNNILKELSQHLTNAYKTRDEVINKITYESNSFKIPPRVTLTTLKKESWLKDLANPNIPLLKISNKLPHGIKNKTLVDTLSSKNVPITRAIWFTKCTLYSELMILRRKIQSKQLTHASPHPNPRFGQSPEYIESQWLQEWTQQVVDYVYKFSKEMSYINSPEKKQLFNSKLGYLLTYLKTLYIECLLDKEYFISNILRFLRDGLPLEPQNISQMLAVNRSDNDENISDLFPIEITIDYGRTLVALTLVKIFWKEILKLDYLCKELSELLLFNYYFILKVPAHSTKSSHKTNEKAALPSNLKQKILLHISDSVEYLFKYNTNVFIIPNYWMLINEVLYNILLGSRSLNTNDQDREEIERQLKLINYRNESLMLNMRHLSQTSNSIEMAPPSSNNRLPAKRNSFLNASIGGLPFAVSPSTSNLNNQNNHAIQENHESGDHTFINRRNYDNLKIIEQFDRLQLNDELASYLRPKPDNWPNSNTWRSNLKLTIYWCITNTRDHRKSSEEILIICNFLKRNVLQKLSGKNTNNWKAEFENEIMEIIYEVVDKHDEEVNYYYLYVLINELYQLKVIAISSYLRKLIASGIFYITPGTNTDLPEGSKYNRQVDIHLSILRNLPVLNNKQCNSILQKWTPQGFNFNEKFEKGKQVLQEQIINKLLNNSFDDNIEQNMDYIKELNVGLKFMLVNWITTNLKNSISNSPRLIHVTPSIIANIYNFYSLCDNLTVFFKVFVRFILRNEGKIIIFYLDSLYFISKLIIRHFKLVKFIAGNNYESANTGYDLFKLTIINYKDLQNRDTDYFRFHDVWNFINRAVENSEATFNNGTSISKNNPLYAKEMVDSPMKIHMQENNKVNEKYSAEDFRNDLEVLIETPAKLMSQDEINDALSVIDFMNVDVNAFKDLKRAKESVIIISEFMLKNGTHLNERQEISLFKLLINLSRILEAEQPLLFMDQLQTHIIESIKMTEEVQQLIIHFKKMLIYEVLQIRDLIMIFQKGFGNKDTGFQKKCNILIYDIFFETQTSLERQYLLNHQILFLEVLRYFYNIKDGTSELLIASKALKEDQKESIYQSYILENYKQGVYAVLKNSFFLHTKVTIDTLTKQLDPDSIIDICNDLLYLKANPISSKEDTFKLMKIISEFNLPIVQCLLKAITSKGFLTITEENLQETIEQFVEMVLDNLNFQFLSYNSYFGELFNYLNWRYKVKVFNTLENLFLCNTVFNFFSGEPTDLNKSDEDIYLRRKGSSMNLLPVFKDYFKKFSVSSMDDIPSSYKFFQDLSKFLLKLVHAVNSDVALENKNSGYLGDSISIFLRILIIHKISLTSIIVRHDGEQFTFIKNLISLLNSRFLSTKSEKLKILLYDLLLLMKSSLTTALIDINDTSLGDSTSPALNITNNMSPAPTDETIKMNVDGVPVNDHLNQPSYSKPSASGLPLVSSMFNLPEPNNTNPFKDCIDDTKVASSIMLDEQELTQDGDIHNVNNSDLILVSTRRDTVSFSSAFGLLEGSNVQQPTASRQFSLKSYQLLEEAGNSVNDGCINLLLFDAYTTKENIP